MHLNQISGSFGWPLRGPWHRRWAIGVVAALLLPLGFVPLLGYAVANVRAAARGDSAPPPWAQLGRLLADGLCVGLAIAIVTAPFALVALPLASGLSTPLIWRSADPLLHVEGWTAAILLLALPWGIAVLLLMPHATARFAASGRLADLLDFPASLRMVRGDFGAWNLAIAAIVTAWAIGVAGAALACVGLAPGIFYAILVSAHATATLGPARAHPPPR